MSNFKLCKYTKTCPVFKGEVAINGTPLSIYRNVFCRRGDKGWNNCEQYLEFKVNSLSKNTSFNVKNR
ncbi:hypothetical protein JCM21142_94007 [Saccharicrinis fermentans DSM 9555 = JCM 21142]|uniref:Uncharacterized protein n=1 Tax=Saccharicrinis fermentans DSM 9555 = JCM 21142 TaxID=869213 RepID=W7Y366_9BACT|nr:hypothetical protein JCM21142_94007 [Saccharicrinis fermentans DSM 9555 = JCM 21142]